MILPLYVQYVTRYMFYEADEIMIRMKLALDMVHDTDNLHHSCKFHSGPLQVVSNSHSENCGRSLLNAQVSCSH